MQRAVKVMIPGAHFPTLTPAEQAVEYEGTAMEFDMNHKSLDGTIRRGVPHTSGRVSVLCASPTQLMTLIMVACGRLSSSGTAGVEARHVPT